MSIRVTCNNGHRFTVEAEFLQRSRSCPKCQAEYTWSFRLRCSKGHKLKVPGRYAGQVGKCPQCDESVRVPEIAEPESAETLITNLLQDDGEKLSGSDSAIIGGDGATATVPAWQAALADLQGGNTSGDSSQSHTGNAKSLNDTLNQDEDGWKSRRCPHCKKFVDVARKSCTECGKYIGIPNPDEIARSQRCNSCGAMSYPGAESCTACGIPFG